MERALSICNDRMAVFNRMTLCLAAGVCDVSYAERHTVIECGVMV